MMPTFITRAFRNAFRYKFRTLMAVLILGLGLAFSLLAIIYFHYESSYDRFHERHDQIYRVAFETSGQKLATSGAPLYSYLATQASEVEAVTRVSRRTARTITLEDRLFFESNIVYADSTVFDVLTLPLLEQESDELLRGESVVIISELLAEKYFGKKSALGQQIKIGSRFFKVEAVMANMPQNSHLNFDMILPIALSRSNNGRWTSNNFLTYVLLYDQSGEEALLQSLATAVSTHLVGETHFKDKVQGEAIDLVEKTAMLDVGDGRAMGYKVQPLANIHLYSARQGEFQPNGGHISLIVLGSVALLLLIITVINYSNLMIYGLTLRFKEICLRRILGAGRNSIFVLFCGEALLVTLLGFAFAVLLVLALFPLFNQTLQRNIDLNSYIHPGTIALTIGAWLLLTGITVLIPSIVSRSITPLKWLAGTNSLGWGKKKLQSLMITVQATFLLIFLMATFGIRQQLDYVKERPKGFDENQVQVIRNGYNIADGQVFKNQLLQSPDVVAASFVDGVPGGGMSNSTFSNVAGNDTEGIGIWYSTADEDYLETIGMQLTRGRNFQPLSFNDSSSIIVTEQVARLLGIAEDPLGKSIAAVVGNSGVRRQFEIIGLIEDVHFESLYETVKPYAVLYGNGGSLMVKTRAGAGQEVLDEAWNTFEIRNPMRTYNLEEWLFRFYSGDASVSRIVGLISLIAFITTLIGSQTVAALSVQSSLKNLSIRRVLGASYGQMSFVFSSKIANPLLMALLVGIPVGAWLVSNWLNNFAYRQVDYAVMIGASASVLVLIDVLILGYIVWRCRRFNPSTILRENAD